MKFTGVFLFAIVIGIMAAALCVIDNFLAHIIGPEAVKGKGLVWISFIAWAIYFLAGGNVLGGVKATIGYAIGIIASISIILLVGVLPTSLGAYAVPLAVLVVAPFLICFENVPFCNFIPAMFVASGTYFGIMNYVPGATMGGAFGFEMCYALLGFVFGWLSLIFRAPIQKNFAIGSHLPH